MSIQVIGAGFGRTGTKSLQEALQQLGFDKCYHMYELITHPEQLKHWQALDRGEQPDWDELFRGYKATVDFPGCMFYKQMMQRYPDAKVILSVRDPKKWYKSAYETIYQKPEGLDRAIMKFIALFSPKVRGIFSVTDWAQDIIWKRMFSGKFEDRTYAEKVFMDFNEEVKRTVPAEKLLVFEVQQGWEPLCKFLNVPVPSTPFPRVNDTEEFNKRRVFNKAKKLQE